MNERYMDQLLHRLGKLTRLLGDLLAVNMLWILCSLPVITIGAASSAAYAVLLRRVMHGEIPIFKTWCASFKSNFRQSLAFEGILAVAGLALWADVQMVFSFTGAIRWAYAGACGIIAVIFFVIALFALPQQTLFDNSMKGIVKNAFALAFCYPGKFLLCCLYWVAVIGSALYLPWDIVERLGFLWLMWGLSCPAWLTSKVLISIFAKLDPSIKENEDK